MPLHRWLLPTVFAWALCAWPAAAGDWPMWRYDSARGNATPDALPKNLHLHWVRQLPPAHPAWGPDQTRLQYDAAPQPVVMGQQILVPSTTSDSVTAYHTTSGKEQWRFYAEGPVRFAPVAHKGKVYFVSDDGYLYCLAANDGSLQWKVHGGPTPKWLIGNHRLISAWPARGGPVLHQGRIFFTASIWPFMGIFIHAVDPDTGAFVWTNSGDGSNFITHPHGAGSFGGVAPQGHLAAAGDRLVVPGGRSLPAIFDTHTGKLIHFHFEHRTGSHAVMAAKKVYFSAGDSNVMADGQYLGALDPAVMDGDTVYYQEDGVLVTERITELKTVTKKDRKGKDYDVQQLVLEELGDFTLKHYAGEVILKAGSRLYTAGKGKIAVFELSGAADRDTLHPVWQTDIEGEVHHLLAGDNRLFVVTTDARLLCFAAGNVPTMHHALAHKALSKKHDSWADRADEILYHHGDDAGMCVALGVGSGRLIEELLRRSTLQIFVIEPDADKADAFRRKMDLAGLYGLRVSVHVGDPANFALPPYLASLVVAEEPADVGMLANPALLQKMFAALRPYGGMICLELTTAQHQQFAKLVPELDDKQATLARKKEHSLLTRAGALPGAGDWTHQYADAAQTGVSKDKLVRAPLGLLWFGGPSNDKVLPRHGHGPSPQVAGGRLFIEGPDSLRAMDVYTGRVLWEIDLKNFGKFYDKLLHAPGAGEIGSNYVSLPDKVYAVYGNVILELDAATGSLNREFKLAPVGKKAPPPFGFIAVWDDLLIATVDPVPIGGPTKLDFWPFNKGNGDDDPNVKEDKTEPKKPADDKKKSDCGDNGTPGADKKAPSAGKIEPLPSGPYAAGSKKLVVFNRVTGEFLWSREAEFTFRHNAIAVGTGKVFCIDNITEEKKKALKRKGITFDGTPVLYALDARTGKPVWSTTKNVFGTFLNYSEKYDLLLQAGSKYRDRPGDEVDKGMIGYRGKDGKVLWQDLSVKYDGPCLLWRDKILTNGLGGFALDVLTGKVTGWKYNRQYGCNTALGSEFLLTFRSGCAGYYDLDSDSGTCNLGGFRSSCTNNLIVADGVLSAPDYTRTCTCAYQNQSSLALIHMPDVEMWAYGGVPKPGQVGYHFGAPGDRRAPTGTLWQAVPAVAVKTSDKDKSKTSVKLKLEPAQPEIYRLHSSQVEGGLNWVAATGFVGIQRITIPVTAKKNYKLRLVFGEPADIGPGARTFDVMLQGKTVLEKFDIAKAAGKAKKCIFREFKVTPAKSEIVLEFQAAGKLPAVISGVELTEQ